MPTLLTPYASLLGLKVRVYRNLHNGLFSIQHRGRVVAHLPQLTLSGVTFQVQPAGRAKVLATRAKNVHAYVSGTVCASQPVARGIHRDETRVSYNPYKSANFATSTGRAVTAANAATIDPAGIWIY